MAKERNNYEMPNNEEFEDLLQDNLRTLKPLEIKEKEVGGEKQLFPFWNPVEPEDVHYSPESYLNAKQKKERSIDSDDNVVNRMEDIMGKMKNTQMVDMTDAVKPHEVGMSNTSTTHQVTNWNSTSEDAIKIASNAATPKGDNVGAVKPKEADMSSTATKEQVTNWDSTQNEPKSKLAEPYGGIDFSKFM